jgi:hypothetical protein
VVRLRLLTIGVALVIAASLASCSRCYGSRRVEVPRLAGQILDKRTGKPIEGMAVYQAYETFNRMAAGGHGSGGGERDFRFTMTDADGRFEFPAHVVAEALKNYVEIDPEPWIHLVHREYGTPLVYVPKDSALREQIVWEVEPAAESFARWKSECGSWCRDLEDHDAYHHCYQLACGEPVPNGFGPQKR